MSTLQTSLVSSSGLSNEQIQLKKLKQQNIQLHKQVFQLQKQVNEVLSRQQHKKIKNMEVEKQLTSLYGQQLDDQQKKIKKLKEQVYYLKSSNAKLNMEYLNKQEDQLALLNQERDQLLREKQLLKHNIKDKKGVLDKNHGLQTHKNSLETQYTQTKKSNTKKLAQIIQIERQLRKYHFIAQTIKNTPTQSPNNQPLDMANLQMEFQQLAHQIAKSQRDIKEIQGKWKPSIDALDTEYFTLSSEEKTKKIQLQSLIKRFKVIEHRSKSLRDQGQILQDRNRLSKIVTSTSSVGFTQSLLRKNSIKESHSYLPETQKKSRIKSDFILKEFQNLKVKNRKQAKQISVKPIDSLFSHNKTFDLGLKKQSPIKPNDKQTKTISRSLTQAEIPVKQKIIKLKPKPQSPQKQAQLKITQPPKPKITRNQSLKSNNQKNQKSISLIQPKPVQKDVKSKNQTLKPQNHKINPIKSSPKRLIDRQIIQNTVQPQQNQRKKDIQKSKQIKSRVETKGIKQSVPKDQSKTKIPQKSHISIQKSAQNKPSIKPTKENFNQVGAQKVSKEKILANLKSKEKIGSKQLSNQEPIVQIIKSKSTSKVNPLKVPQINNPPRQQRQKTIAKKEAHLQKAIPKQQRHDNQNKRQIKQKDPKELKESIQIKQKKKQLAPANQQQKAPKKVINKGQEKQKKQTKQSERIEIHLENKINTIPQPEKHENLKENTNKINPKSLESIKELQPKSPKREKSSTRIEKSPEMNSEVKQEVVQQFKPYLIKRKRQGGALNFQNKEQESKQKANLLKLIEKQSIGVGIQ